MSEAAVARANARSGTEQSEAFRCVQCRQRFLTASGLAFHEQQAHRGKKNVALVIPVVPVEMPPSVLMSKKAAGFSGQMLSLIALRGLICHWCKKPMRVDMGQEHPLAPTREHLMPKSQRGDNSPENIALAHRQCNALRGVIDAEAFRRLMTGDALTREDLWPEIFSVRNS